VPYQVERSRLLGKDKVKVRVPPINCTDAVAGRVIVAVAAKGDLKLKIDDKGVYLEPKPEGTDDNPLAERRLSVNERMRFGHLVQLEIDALHGKDIDKRWWGDRDVEQQVQLEITVRGIQAFKGLKLVTYIYARIQRDSLRTDEYREDKRPRYGPNRDFVEIHKQTIPIPVLARMTPQAFNTDAVLLEYEVEDYYYSGKRRYGEKYYGYVVDVYLGNDLIKSVASSAKMHELIGRHKRTGFPIR